MTTQSFQPQTSTPFAPSLGQCYRLIADAGYSVYWNTITQEHFFMVGGNWESGGYTADEGEPLVFAALREVGGQDRDGQVDPHKGLTHPPVWAGFIKMLRGDTTHHYDPIGSLRYDVPMVHSLQELLPWFAWEQRTQGKAIIWQPTPIMDVDSAHRLMPVGMESYQDYMFKILPYPGRTEARREIRRYQGPKGPTLVYFAEDPDRESGDGLSYVPPFGDATAMLVEALTMYRHFPTHRLGFDTTTQDDAGRFSSQAAREIAEAILGNPGLHQGYRLINLIMCTKHQCLPTTPDEVGEYLTNDKSGVVLMQDVSHLLKAGGMETYRSGGATKWRMMEY